MQRRMWFWGAMGGCMVTMILLSSYESSAQWGAIQRGAERGLERSVEKGVEKSIDKATDPGQKDAKGVQPAGKGSEISSASAAPVTYKNTSRRFQFTIPAGWTKTSGDPESEGVSFMKAGSSWGFNVHMTQMTPSFPRKSAVEAGLKQDKERIAIKQIFEARKRDDGDSKKKCGVIGWEIVEAPQKNESQRIIWQCYDGDNYYMNFMAYAGNDDFPVAKATLREIMDSVKFCK